MRGEKMHIPFTMPFIGEEEVKAVADVVRSTWLTQGECVQKFENKFAEYAGIKEAVAVFNGTAALHLSMISAKVRQGDEVIVPSFTFIATVNAVRYQGAIPVFADIDPKTFNILPEDIEKKITNKTKAIIPVHYGGQMADMDAIMEIAKEHDLCVIEDAAEAHGAKYKGKHAGTFGDLAIFSFTPTKPITTGEGGMIFTNDSEVAEQLRMLRNHGMDAPYHHIMLGYNYRMTEMQAALGLVQLNKLDEILEKKNKIAKLYNQKLQDVDGITTPYVAPYTTMHGYMIYTIKVNEQLSKMSRDKMMSLLAKYGIETKIYFPPVHMQPYYKSLGYNEGILPITESICKEVLSLPCYAKLSKENIDHILAVIKKS